MKGIQNGIMSLTSFSFSLVNYIGLETRSHIHVQSTEKIKIVMLSEILTLFLHSSKKFLFVDFLSPPNVRLSDTDDSLY